MQTQKMLTTMEILLVETHLLEGWEKLQRKLSFLLSMNLSKGFFLQYPLVIKKKTIPHVKTSLTFRNNITK